MFEQSYIKDTCWWCKSTTNQLTGEHKFKRTDIDLLFREEGNLIRIVGEGELKGLIKSPKKSPFLKFNKTLCYKCNNSLSQKMDKSYERFMTFYNVNKSQIMNKSSVHLSEIYKKCQEKESFNNLERYLVKHICCRLVEDQKILPSNNMINFLNGSDKLKDVKIIFRLKPFKYENIYNSPYKSTLKIIERKNIWGQYNKIATAGWYTLNQLSFNYLIEKDIVKNREYSPIIHFDKINYNQLSQFVSNEKDPHKLFMKFYKHVEEYPFQNSPIDFYNFLKFY